MFNISCSYFFDCKKLKTLDSERKIKGFAINLQK